MNRFVVRGGRVIDPAQAEDRITNLLIENGRVADWDADANAAKVVVEAAGKIVAPGFVDTHVQLREPGEEGDETIETGCRAAVAGGYASIACLPNTDPPVDTPAGVQFIQQRAARADLCNVFVLACVSKDRQGEQLAEMGALVEAGAVGFTDAASPICNSELLRRALQYALMFDKPILNRPEAVELSQGGVMHEGLTSLILGLAGMPADAEDVMTGRDLRLVEATGGRMHLLSLSSAVSVDSVRRAKKRGVRVTAEVHPHHFALTDESLRSFDANFKVNPPLRSPEHLAACIEGLQDGAIDVISSGHAPRAAEKKALEIDRAPFGAVGLETTLGVVATYLIHTGSLDWPAALEKMTINPAQVLGLDRGHLRVGAAADFVIIAPQARWKVNAEAFCSKSANSPFLGMELQGRVEKTFVGGVLKFDLNCNRATASGN